MKYNTFSALELKDAIDTAESWPLADSQWTGMQRLVPALKEIERLRGICRDIIDVVNITGNDRPNESLEKIEDLAQKYYEPGS